MMYSYFSPSKTIFYTAKSQKYSLPKLYHVLLLRILIANFLYSKDVPFEIEPISIILFYNSDDIKVIMTAHRYKTILGSPRKYIQIRLMKYFAFFTAVSCFPLSEVKDLRIFEVLVLCKNI